MVCSYVNLSDSQLGFRENLQSGYAKALLILDLYMSDFFFFFFRGAPPGA